MGFGQNSSDSSSFPSVWSRRTRLPPQIIRTAMSSVCFKLVLQSQSSDKFHTWDSLF